MFKALLVAIAGIILFTTEAKAQDYTPLPDPGVYNRDAPMLVCWQAERLIAALQPGVQGIPEYCAVLEPPLTLQLGPRVWEDVLEFHGITYLVGIFEVQVLGRRGTMFTVFLIKQD